MARSTAIVRRCRLGTPPDYPEPSGAGFRLQPEGCGWRSNRLDPVTRLPPKGGSHLLCRYSCRIAVIGSIPAARRAGIRPASIAHSVSATTAMAIARGIARPEAEQQGLDVARAGERQRHAETHADGGHQDDVAKNHPDDMTARGSERHANPDLVRSPRHVEGDRAVEPDTRDDQREGREAAAETRQRDFGADRLVDVRRLRLRGRRSASLGSAWRIVCRTAAASVVRIAGSSDLVTSSVPMRLGCLGIREMTARRLSPLQAQGQRVGSRRRRSRTNPSPSVIVRPTGFSSPNDRARRRLTITTFGEPRDITIREVPALEPNPHRREEPGTDRGHDR